VYWRVEGSLLELTTVRPVAFFTWNAQTFAGRWMRRGFALLVALLRPLLYVGNRKFATRVVYSVLRGISRDRLDLLGEEEFQYKLKPHLRPEGVCALKALVNSGADVVLFSQGLDHVMRPLARHLGVRWLCCNRLEFRDELATGRLIDPVIRPRGVFARMKEAGPDGRRPVEQWSKDLGSCSWQGIERAIIPAERESRSMVRPVVHWDGKKKEAPLSVRKVLAGKHVMLIGVTGFIGKVWLANTLLDLCSRTG
jgi:hypothetical protein